MDPGTGRIYDYTNGYPVQNHTEAARAAMQRGHVIIPPDKIAALKKASIPARKGWARNQPCPCGSGSKFKKCCWDKYA